MPCSRHGRYFRFIAIVAVCSILYADVVSGYLIVEMMVDNKAEMVQILAGAVHFGMQNHIIKPDNSGSALFCSLTHIRFTVKHRGALSEA